MKRFQEIFNSSDLVRRAFDFAKLAHAGQKRKNGEPYFNHPVAAAEAVAEWGLDEITVAAALLHDVVEDTGCPIEKIKEQFGEETAFLVDGVTKLGKIKYRGVERQVENLRKFILALSQDIRVVIVKLADRLHNMRTLSALPPQKQKRIALETMDIYAPLAYRLGMQKLSGELEDLAFPYLYPQEYKWLIKNVKDKYAQREQYSNRLKPVLETELKNNEINLIRVESRAKRYSSLYKKLLRYDMNVENIYDLVALRVIVKDLEDCYAALGIIHKIWLPVPRRFKDYIALPKPNGYQSLHTTVFGPENKITEIQIKTARMHEEAEHGIAAHFAYAQNKGAKAYLERTATFADAKELGWVQQLQNWQKNFSNEDDFLQSLKIDFFKDRILALTPKGEVIDLPVGATPVDFAYQIHTDIGDSCVGARINGKITPLDHQLRSGDVVEILTQKNKKPSESWLNFVKTASAKNHIHTALKNKSRGLIRRGPETAEIKVIAEDRMGLLKDITAVISRSHVNILGVNSAVTSRFPAIKIRCAITDRAKIEKLLLKIKELGGIKEISYQLI